jgi:hypothetical protein
MPISIGCAAAILPGSTERGLRAAPKHNPLGIGCAADVAPAKALQGNPKISACEVNFLFRQTLYL